MAGYCTIRRKDRPRGRLPACFFAFILPVSALAHGPLHDRLADLTAQLERDPANASLYVERGELHRHHRDWKAAEDDYTRAQHLNPQLAGIDFFRGRMLFESEQRQAALAALNRYLSDQPGQPDALIIRGRVLLQLDEPLAAARDFDDAISQLREPQPEHYLERARALAAANAVQEALRGLDEGVTRLGLITTLQLYAIELDLKAGHYDAALARLDTVAARSPVKAHWLLRRGEILEAAQRPHEARVSYEAAVAEIRSVPSSRRDTNANHRMEARLAADLERLSYTAEDSKAEAPPQAR